MNVQDLRRDNLQRILRGEFAGNKSAMARRVKREQSYVSELISGKRNFGEKMARYLETVLGLPRGSLDAQPARTGIAESPVEYRVHRWPFAFDQARLAKLTNQQREQIERIVIALIHDFEVDNHRPKRPRKAGSRQ